MSEPSVKILGIESSCDETSVAIVENGTKLLSMTIAAQDDIHAPYGGIVPELASRCHIERIEPFVSQALKRAECELSDIDGIAVTNGPGLVGSLIVGLSFAKALGYARKIPVVGINHLEAHLHAIQLEQKVDYPFIGLLVSGGHTALYDVRGVVDMHLLGTTRDDAAGEAFDKVAKLLGLGYPGGKKIDDCAKLGNPKAIAFPRPHRREKELHFSFSGLKTSVLHYLKKLKEKPTVEERADIAASFQEAVVETLVHQSLKALKQTNQRRLVMAGGVAANSRLRSALNELQVSQDIDFYYPSLKLCTDNAAMVAALGHHYIRQGEVDSLSLNAYANCATITQGRPKIYKKTDAKKN